jgi:pilus assembly protein CpaB
MKLARVAVLGVAVGAGLLAALIAMNMSSAPPPPAPKAEVPQVVKANQVLVATKDINIGTKLDAGSVEWRDWPSNGLSTNFIVRQGEGKEQIDPIVGAVARGNIFAGEPIIAGKLLRSDQGVMAAILPKGMRAVATRIAADTSAGGFILPNDRVDVIMTRQVTDGGPDAGGGGDNRFRTETILSNVRVLAIDQMLGQKDTGETVVVGQTATLELSPQQAEILTVAQQMSDRLTLALRSAADSDPRADQGEDATHLIGGTRKNGAVTVVRSGIAHDVSAIR